MGSIPLQYSIISQPSSAILFLPSKLTYKILGIQSVHGATRKTLLKIKGFSEVKVEKIKEAIQKCQVGKDVLMVFSGIFTDWPCHDSPLLLDS